MCAAPVEKNLFCGSLCIIRFLRKNSSTMDSARFLSRLLGKSLDSGHIPKNNGAMESRKEKQTDENLSSSFFQERGVAHLLDLLEEGDRAKAFLWALVLQREKILLLRKEGKEEWIFEEEGKGSFIRVPPVALSTEHVKELNMWLQDVYANS